MMKNKKNQNENQEMDMGTVAQVFETVVKSIFGNNASVMLVYLESTTESDNKMKPAKKNPTPKRPFSLARTVREHIMQDILVADFCAELSEDMITLAGMVELMEKIFADVAAGKLSEKKAQKLVSEVSQFKSEITEKWSAFYAEGT